MFKSPFYIFTPPYRNTSAGIKVLYNLAYKLSLLGCQVYIQTLPKKYNEISEKPNLTTPSLNKSIIDYYNCKKLNPVVIYPEVYDSEIFSSKIKIRYLLSEYNLILKKDEYLISYSKKIFSSLKKHQKKKNLGILPLFVLNSLFLKKKYNNQRNLICYYAAKYEENYKLKVPAYFKNFTKITRDKISSQSILEIRKIFIKSKVFYCFEESQLALEAMLCGCPVVFVKSKILQNQTILGYELEKKGYFFSDVNEIIKNDKIFFQKIKKAKKETKGIHDIIYNLNIKNEKKLRKFVSKVDKIANNKNFKKFELSIKQNLFEKFFLQLLYIYNFFLFYGFRLVAKKTLNRILYNRFNNL
jgi:hypothetical protein